MTPSRPGLESNPLRRAHLAAARPRTSAPGLRPALLAPLLIGLLCWALAITPGAARAGTVPGEMPAYVGQLSTVSGDVRWYDRDSAGWVGGTQQQPLRNWPLAAGDRLRTGPDGRAELRVGSTTLRLGADVDLTLQRLDAQRLEVWLQSGTLALRVSDAVPGDRPDVVLLTPEGRWLPRRPGSYRFERQANARSPATLATNWRGELRFEGRDSALLIPAGRRADLWLDGERGPTRYAWGAVERDSFADWVARDERQDDAPATARRVPPGMTGWQDLDRHGDWINDPTQGDVWQPRVVAPGWAPYQDGRWAWVAPWGWTWIDAAPWGFAPFHYGSWIVVSGRWCWSPGPRQVRPHYAPALSAWVSGPSVGIGIQIGGGGRPPPPRIVAPVVVINPRPVVVIHPPPPHGGQRQERYERQEHHDGRDGRDGREGRDGRDWRDRREGRDGRDAPGGHEHQRGADRRDSTDRREGPDRSVRISPLMPQQPPPSVQPPQAVPPVLPVPPVPPVPPFARTQPPRHDSPATVAPPVVRIEPPRGDGPGRPERPQSAERPDRHDASERAARGRDQAQRGERGERAERSGERIAWR